MVSELVKLYVEEKWRHMWETPASVLERYCHDVQLVPGYVLCCYFEADREKYCVPLKTNNEVMFWHRYGQVCRVISQRADTYYDMIIYNSQLMFNGNEVGEYGHNKVHTDFFARPANFIARLPCQEWSIDTIDPDIIRQVVVHPSFKLECEPIEACERVAILMSGFPYTDVELLKVLAVFVIAEKIHYQSANRPIHSNRYLFLKTIMEYFAENHTLLHGGWKVKLLENPRAIKVIQEQSNHLRHQTIVTGLRTFIDAKQNEFLTTL